MKTSIVFLFFIFAASPSHAEGFTADYHKTVLENGAVVVCRHVPESPLVTVQIRVLSGLSNEGEYAGSGISHFLEHLVFKGTHDRTSEEIRREVKAMGGVVNGATGLDSVEYHITVPNKNFRRALDLLVDMVTEPVFTDKGMEKERDVILKEIRLHNDDPVSRRTRLLFSQAYREHVYKYPILGYEELFKKLTREDILRYHAAVYTPEKMVVGIAGGIPPDTALEAAEEALKEYQRSRGIQADVPVEPEQINEVRAEFSADVTLGYMAVGFHTTSLYSPDLYAGDVLSILLGEGNDSRLYKRLVKDKQLLYTVSSHNYTPRYPGLFIVTGTGDPDMLEQARQEIFAVIEELNSGDIRDREMERARNLVISDYLHSHERIARIAASMTSSQILTGDPAFFEKYVDEIKRVEKEKVGELVSKYLTGDNSTTVFLLPRDYHAREQTLAAGKQLTEGVREAGPEEAAEPAGFPEPEQREDADVKSLTLKNGLRIIVKRKGALPLVSATLAVPGGLMAEETGKDGISNLTASLILKGTRERGEDEIIPALEKMGGSIGTFSGMNSTGVAMDLIAGDLSAGLDIFEDVVKHAVFPEEEIIKQKKKITASIREQEKDIFDNGMIQLRGLLYGDHPYARKLLGEVQTVDSISRDEIAAFYKRCFAPEKAVLTVVGDVDVEKTADNLAKRFAGWEGKNGRPREMEVVPLEGTKREDIVMRKEQSLLLVGFQGVRIKDERKYELALISSLLSGSDGLLFHTVREEEGAIYTSGAVSVPGAAPGYFMLYAATTEENIEKVRNAVFGVLKKIIDGDVTKEEIESSKNSLISRHAHSIETNYSMSMMMTLDEFYGLGFQDYKGYPAEITALTRDDIIRCAGEILDLDRCAVVVIHSE
ncbi:MAG: hypothetical protein DRP85_04905 [Candidatus Makaraimicrobium thalassicum]|nr:MAG: hypothetical protein DRP85_04905 [Candidatus Omnitrophota bacterium]